MQPIENRAEGLELNIPLKQIHLVKERRLTIVEFPSWVDHNENGDLCLFSDEDAFIDIPSDAENLKDVNGNLDEVKLGLYLFNYTDCVKEHWVDKYAFAHLLEAHQYGDAEDFPYGFKIEPIPFK